MKKKQIWIFLFLLGISLPLMAQEQGRDSLAFFQPANTFHSKRFWTATTGVTVAYSGVSVALYRAWYKNYNQSAFHFFDDYGEWQNIDKFGHLYTTYHESRVFFLGANWTGMKRTKAIFAGWGIGLFLQSTLEVMDGFSTKWGFSVSDMAFNVTGASLFATQEWLWREQRIGFKLSATPHAHSNELISSVGGGAMSSPSIRADDLFGQTYVERFLKDYNGQILWMSFNPASFLENKPGWLPKWLNLAVGYGAENLYGGFANEWDEGEHHFVLNKDDYPRYRQYYLSFDVDFTKIPTKSYFLKSLLYGFNFIKIPSPTLEWSRGRLKFYPIYW